MNFVGVIKITFILHIFLLFSFKNIDKKDSYTSIINVHSTFDNKIENEIFIYINLHRKSVGLKPLQLNDIESSAAAKHSNNMASGKVSFGHAGFQKRIKTI